MANDAEKITQVGIFRDWTVYQSISGPKECGIISIPKETVNTRNGRTVSVRRGDIYLTVSIDPKSIHRYLIAFTGGYPFAKGSTVSVAIGSRSFKFEIGTTANTAEWAWPLESDDDEVVSAMRAGMNAVVSAVSQRGTNTRDTFSLLGFTSALDRAVKNCPPEA